MKRPDVECKRQEIIELYQHDIAPTSIAQKYACSAKCIRNILIDANVYKSYKHGVPFNYILNRETLKELCNKGYTLQKIADHFNIKVGAALYALQKLGLQTQSPTSGTYGTLQEKKDTVMALHKQGYNYQDIADKVGHNKSKVSVMIRENRERKSKYKWDFDEHYFDKIDTPNKAWVFGYFLADACCSPQINKFSIGSVDFDVIDKIRNELKYNGPIGVIKHPDHPKWKDAYTINITHPHLIASLVQLGCGARKTYDLKFPTGSVPDEFLSHFLRGIYEGDGHISFRYHAHNYSVGVVGTKDLLIGIQNIIMQYLNIKTTLHLAHEKKNNFLYALYIYNRKDCLTFLDYIYKDATIYMNRKYLLYQEAKSKYLLETV